MGTVDWLNQMNRTNANDMSITKCFIASRKSSLDSNLYFYLK